jgi:hypothetical protein
MTSKESKDKLVNIRMKPLTREEFRVAAELRGATMSGLLHQFIVKTIREEKERNPEMFFDLKIPEELQQKDSEYMMSIGTDRLPTDDEKAQAGRDLAKAKKLARNNERTKRQGRAKKR